MSLNTSAPSVNVEDGEVIVEATGLAFSLSPDAASELADNLIAAAMQARRQIKSKLPPAMSSSHRP